MPLPHAVRVRLHMFASPPLKMPQSNSMCRSTIVNRAICQRDLRMPRVIGGSTALRYILFRIYRPCPNKYHCENTEFKLKSKFKLRPKDEKSTLNLIQSPHGYVKRKTVETLSNS